MQRTRVALAGTDEALREGLRARGSGVVARPDVVVVDIEAKRGSDGEVLKEPFARPGRAGGGGLAPQGDAGGPA